MLPNTLKSEAFPSQSEQAFCVIAVPTVCTCCAWCALNMLASLFKSLIVFCIIWIAIGVHFENVAAVISHTQHCV